MKFPNFSGAAMQFGNALQKAAHLPKMTNLKFELKKTPKGRGLSVYQGSMYCGPKWGFTRQDLDNHVISQLPDAVDIIDAACKVHDQGYNDNGYYNLAANIQLIKDMIAVSRSSNATPQQKTDAVIIAGFFVFLSAATVKPSDGKQYFQSMRDSFMRGQQTMGEIIDIHIKKAKSN